MRDLFKGVHLLTQSEYDTLAANEELDPSVLYVTPENVTEIVRLHTDKISENSENIDVNKQNIAINSAEILKLKNSAPATESDVVEIKNAIQEIILRDTTQDNRLTTIENDYATKESLSELTSNVVTIEGTQIITGLKMFSEHIYLINADGTADRISHLNNNFIIHSGATNSAVLNIDEGLSKIYAFNKELAFKSDVAEVSGTTVYVNNTAVEDLRFDSDPQTQINNTNTNVTQIQTSLSDLTTTVNAKANQSDLQDLYEASTNAVKSLDTRVEGKADKDLSNVTYPQLIANGTAQTGAGDRVVESKIFSDGLTWYRKWASGWKECGGITGEMTTYRFEITLPIAFTNTNYIVQANPIRTGEDTFSWNTESKDVQKFVLRNRANTPCQWYVCGY